MSRRYSTSPALHLQIGDSRLRRYLLGALFICQLTAMVLIALAGYRYVILLPLSLALAIAPRLLRDRARGLQLSWRGGQWALGRENGPVPVDLLPACRPLPWGIYLAWRESPGGQRDSCWLFADSLSAGELRRLRCRLALQG